MNEPWVARRAFHTNPSDNVGEQKIFVELLDGCGIRNNNTGVSESHYALQKLWHYVDYNLVLMMSSRVTVKH